MSTALALTQSKDLTPEQMKLITDTVARGANKDELALFLYRCKSLGLDPLKPGQIYFIKYGSSPGAIVVGIEGFRVTAHRTGKLSGIRRGVIRDEKGAITHGWAEVSRTDWEHPAREESSLSEYSTGKGNWADMPETMIKKVAEAAALRMAFPNDLGGLYIEEEVQKSEKNAGRITAGEFQPPAEGDGLTEGLEYRIPGGTHKGRGIEELIRLLGWSGAASYITAQEARWQKFPDKKPEWWDDFSERAGDAIGRAEMEALNAEGEK